jgi:hypothetical protein
MSGRAERLATRPKDIMTNRAYLTEWRRMAMSRRHCGTIVILKLVLAI